MAAQAERIPRVSTPPIARHTGIVQPALKVGKPGDRFEQEAESVANQVMMMPANSQPAMMSPLSDGIQMQVEEEEEELQMMPISSTISMVSKQEEEEEVQLSTEEEEQVQLYSEEEEEQIQLFGEGGGTVSSDVSSQIIQSKGSGQNLPSPIQAEMGQKIGADFSSVKIHTGPDAAQMSSQLGAKAFTHGNDIYFNEGNFQPGTSEGKHLLAHELTHTVQQGAAVRRSPEMSVSEAEPQVQRLPWAVREGLSRFASYIPGYSLLTVIIGYDPLAGRTVARNATNLLGGLLGLIPVFGTLLFTKLSELGIIDSAFAWVQSEMAALDLSTNRLERTLESAWDQVSIRNSWDENMAVLDRTFGQLYRDIVSFAGRVKDKIFELIKEAMMAGLKALAESTPGYPLLTKLLGRDPLTGEEVISTTAEKIEAFLTLIGKEQELERMRAEGTIQETADWIDAELAALNFSFEEVRLLFETAWNAFSLEDLRDPLGAFQRTVGIFTPFLSRVFTFAANVAVKVLEFIKNTLLSQLSAYAREQQGFHLITVILGKDPFTQEEVPRTTENIIRGFMGLMPGGEEQFQQMKETGAIEQTVSRIEAAVATLNFTWEYITGLFMTLWNSFTIQDVFAPIQAFVRIIQTLASPIQRLFAFVVTIVKILVEVLLVVMNFPIETVQQIIANAMSAFEDIKRDPIGFLKNLLRAVKQGFVQFFGNIVTHLLGGLRDWLFGELASAGITPPADLSFQSILGFVLEVLGLTMENIWQRLALKIGEERVAQIRGAIDTLTGIWTFIKDVWERGPVAIWEYIQEKISDLWSIVLSQIQNWVMTRIIEQVTVKLLGMLDPTGIMAVVNSFIAFYRAVQSFIEKLREMLEIVNSFVAGVANIARGSIADAANYLENALARAIPVAIGFLANQVGLRGLGTRIGEMIAGLREKINAAIDWLIDKALSVGGAILQAGRNAVSAVTNWWNARVSFQAADGHQHALYLEGEAENASLMIASNPQQFETFIQNLDTRNNPQKETAKQQALAKAIEIDSEKRRRIDRNLSDEQQAEAENTKKTTIERLLGELRDIVQVFFGTDTPDGPPERILPGTDSAGYGTSMHIKKLHLSNKPSDGSTPTQAAHTEYDKLNARRTSSGASYYIRGHLLNHNIGGPGSWDNMVPLSRTGNSSHESSVENQVKAAFDAGAVIEYKVVPSSQKYNSGKSSLISAIDSSNDDGPTKATKKQIVEAESNVPKSLDTEAYTMKKTRNNNFERDRKIVKKKVDNPVERSLTSYFLSDGGVQTKVYLNEETDVSKIREVTGLTSAQVNKMIQSRTSRGQRFGQYATFLRSAEYPETEIESKASELASNSRVSLGSSGS
jgi:hypothetical protein